MVMPTGILSEKSGNKTRQAFEYLTNRIVLLQNCVKLCWDFVSPALLCRLPQQERHIGSLWL